MELKHRKEKELGNEKEVEKKARWHSKLMDSVTEIAVSIGNSLKKTACLIAVPTIVAVGATGCYSSYNRYGEEMPVDSSTDTAVDTHTDTGYDSGTDTVEEDGTCVPADVVEREVTPPCENIVESYSVDNLIGDYLNRRLNDRGENVSGDTDAEYPMGSSDVAENANPFTDGIGGNIGPSEIFMHRISGADFVSLGDYEVYDHSAALSYEESQNIWLNGSSHYSNVLYDVAGDVRFAAYAVKFSGESDGFGIPVCTSGVDGDYTYCKSGAEDADYAYATESHRVQVNFLGSEWIISEMRAPVADVSNEIQVQDGGYVKLAKEAASAILNKEDSLTYNCLDFRFDDIEVHGDTVSAIISILNESGDILKRDKVAEGTTKEFSIDGAIYKLHVYLITDMSHMGIPPKVNVAIFSDEIKVEDGQELDGDSGRFRDWQAFVGWKNKEVSSGQPDHLRTFGIYSDDIASISNSGETTLLSGEGFNFPYGYFSLCYDGLDTTDENLHRVLFRVNSEDNYEIPWTRGPWDPVTGDWAACTLYPPFVKVDIVSDDIYFEKISGESAVSDKFYVAIGGAHCEGSIGDLEAGTYFIQETPYPDSHYIFEEYEGITMLMNFTLEPTYGAHQANIAWAKWEDGGTGYIDHPERPVDNLPTFVFRIGGQACGEEFCWESAYFPTDGNSFNLDVNYTDTGEPVFRREHLVYQYAGPVNSRDTLGFIEEGYITERGSVFSSITDAVSPVVDSQVEYYLSDQVAYSVFYIGKKD